MSIRNRSALKSADSCATSATVIPLLVATVSTAACRGASSVTVISATVMSPCDWYHTSNDTTLAVNSWIAFTKNACIPRPLNPHS